jgi:hypothetical protein
VANVHFGNIGEVWKHLAFAAIVATEQPRHVWEPMPEAPRIG